MWLHRTLKMSKSRFDYGSLHYFLDTNFSFLYSMNDAELKIKYLEIDRKYKENQTNGFIVLIAIFATIADIFLILMLFGKI